MIALKHKHEACAALLNPASAEPLVWPLPLRFISELNPEAKELLEKALMEANRERERANLKDTVHELPSASQYEVEADDTASEVTMCMAYFSFTQVYAKITCKMLIVYYKTNVAVNSPMKVVLNRQVMWMYAAYALTGYAQ